MALALHLELEKKGEPDWNPHTHIIFRDRDIETGKRFLYTSAGPRDRAVLAAKGVKAWSTSDFRAQWADHMNRALTRAGHEVRIDHRTLKEQGIDRTPQTHIGPGRMAAKRREAENGDLGKGERTELDARIAQADAKREAVAAALPLVRDTPGRSNGCEVIACEAKIKPVTAAEASNQLHGLLRRPERDDTAAPADLAAPQDTGLTHARTRTGAGTKPRLPESDPRPSPGRAIGEDYLALCRDPASDLMMWANETHGLQEPHRPQATGGEQGGVPPPRTPRTEADAIVENYLALCSDPGQDLLGWADESAEAQRVHGPAAGREPSGSPGRQPPAGRTPAVRGAPSAVWATASRAMIDDSRAVCRNPTDDPGRLPRTRARPAANDAGATPRPRSDDARRSFRLFQNALRPVQIWLAPGYGRGSGIHDLSSRPAAGLPNHDALQSLQSGTGRSSDLGAVLAAGTVRHPDRYGAPDEALEGTGPVEGFGDGEEALSLLRLCFAELSRLVSRQLAYASATASRDQLPLIRRFIIEERDRHAAFLIKEFQENRAGAVKRNRKKACVPREHLRQRTAAPPGGASACGR